MWWTSADCKTVLLYPYLVDDFGFGSGIAVSNTTMDPFVLIPSYGKGSAVPQSGPCTFYLYAHTWCGDQCSIDVRYLANNWDGADLRF